MQGQARRSPRTFNTTQPSGTTQGHSPSPTQPTPTMQAEVQGQKKGVRKQSTTFQRALHMEEHGHDGERDLKKVAEQGNSNQRNTNKDAKSQGDAPKQMGSAGGTALTSRRSEQRNQETHEVSETGELESLQGTLPWAELCKQGEVWNADW